jgi:hypothetical protein
MATKRQTYINAELEWAEQKLLEWKQYVDENPFQHMKDRIEWKPTAKGGMIPMVIASIESQIKCVRDTMKEYLVLLEQVDKMRQAEEHKKKDVKGGADRPSRMGG